MKISREACKNGREQRPLVEIQTNRDDKEDADGGGLQARSQDVLTGHAGLKKPGIIVPEHPVGTPARQGGVDSDKRRTNIGQRLRRHWGWTRSRKRTTINAPVAALQQAVIDVKNHFAEVTDRPGDDGGEARRRVLGVGEPVFIEEADAALCQTMQEILILVRVIEGSLAIGQGEQQCADEKDAYFRRET